MIRLTLNSQTEPEIHLFNQTTLLIGGESSPADLKLPLSQLEPIHLKISEQNGFLVLINITNDPFVTLNGHPFGKKLLNSGDIIVIHSIDILFEKIVSENNDNEKTIAPLDSSAENLISIPHPPGFDLPFEKEVEILRDEDWKKTALDQYFSEQTPKPVATANIQVASEAISKPASIDHLKPKSLKDDYMKDMDDDHQKNRTGGPFGQSSEPSHLVQAWKWILLFIFLVLAIAAMIGTIMYVSLADKTETEEAKAAQGMADLAMAITYAQLSHSKPNNQNWADVDFLKSNLQAILPQVSSYAQQIDAQGAFNCCPYTLRIYTSSNMSHFLLIAQPAPSVLHWLIPRASIIVDSHLMELRAVKDLRSLNRLLANPDPLEQTNGKDITQAIKQGELIHLSHLAQESNHQDFAPPANLAWINQGAENLIYNAPRYFRLSNQLVKKALSLSTTKGSSQEVTALKQEVENFNILNPLVLYSDQGENSANLIRQALSTYAPSGNLLFGYIHFNAQGKVHQAHLLKEVEPIEKIMPAYPTSENEEDLIALEDLKTKNDESEKELNSSSTVDVNHPIYIQLSALMNARDNELKPHATALQTLIFKELTTPHMQFSIEFQELSSLFLTVDLKYKQLIKETLSLLYHQYDEMPMNEFLLFAKALHLDNLINKEDQAMEFVDENCMQNVETLLFHIEKSKTLTELDNLIQIASTWLTFDYIKDAKELMNYQNMLRNHTLEQLKKYLLVQKDPQKPAFRPSDREVLLHILSLERLIKPDEKEYFLSEFDELLNAKQTSTSTQLNEK